MSKLLVRLIWIGFLAAAFMNQALAQGGATGAITGTVQDSSGASVANAEVRITNQATKTVERTVTTDSDGSFT
ncbi:MAG: Carboxypeptidase regulatory-like domain, partial [Acidobacteriaceae bacterium]